MDCRREQNRMSFPVTAILHSSARKEVLLKSEGLLPRTSGEGWTGERRCRVGAGFPLHGSSEASLNERVLGGGALWLPGQIRSGGGANRLPSASLAEAGPFAPSGRVAPVSLLLFLRSGGAAAVSTLLAQPRFPPPRWPPGSSLTSAASVWLANWQLPLPPGAFCSARQDPAAEGAGGKTGEDR